MRGAILGEIIGSTHEYKDRIKTKEFDVGVLSLGARYY